MNPDPSTSDVVSAMVRRDLYTCVRKSFRTLNPGANFDSNWHVYAMCHALEEVWQGSIRRLIITVPPRHLKSITTSVAFPAWVLGQSPSTRFLVASYGAELGSKHARDFRSVIAAPWYQRAFPHMGQLNRNAEGDLVTSENGGRKAVTPGGANTGFGAHVTIIDDILKAGDAYSEVERERCREFYQSTFRTRVDDQRDVRVVIIQQRLHEDDLVGFLLEAGGFHHLNLPAIAPADQLIPIGNGNHHQWTKGDILSPRLPMDVLDGLRAEMGVATFASQYLQDPTHPDGNPVRWHLIKTYDAVPKRDECQFIVQSWDTAITISQISAFSVCTTWGLHEGVWKLLELQRKRLEFPDLLEFVRYERDRWGADRVLVEEAASGHQVIQSLREERSRRPVVRRRRSDPTECKVVPIRATSDKLTRLAGQMAKLEAGQALFPSTAPWLDVLRHEMQGFPNTKHCDQVDSISQFLEWSGAFRRAHLERPSIISF